MTAVQKAVLDGKRSLVKVPLNKDNSFPHRIDGYFGASKVCDDGPAHVSDCAAANTEYSIVSYWAPGFIPLSPWEIDPDVTLLWLIEPLHFTRH